MNPMTTSEAIVEEIEIKGSAERIFEALTNPDVRIKWWGQEGRFTISHMESDLRPGGKWWMTGTGMQGPVKVQGEYRRVDRPRLLEFTWLPTWQGDNTESLVRFDLEENAGVTKVRITHTGLVTDASRTSHRGWPNILSWLQGYVERTS
jgi:uncharacterized protein YndB with AHSA1/START domain